MPCSLIEVNGLSKHYREGLQIRAVFTDLHLQISSGEHVALFGPSGSGKSTLLNLLAGIDTPDQGQITIDGTNIASLSEQQRTLFRRRHIGMVFQFFNLIPTLTVLENIILPLALNGLDNPHHRSQASELLEKVGLGNRSRSFPEQLSGGEQQRIAIIRALIHSPNVILADEPTGNLDVDTGEQVFSLFLELTRQSKATAIIVTHSPELAQRTDRILRLDHGHLDTSLS